MDFTELISRFAMSLGIGLLVGLERGWTTRADAPGSRTAGIRTFALTGLLGGVAGALARELGGAGGGILLGLAFAAFAAAFAVFAREENRADGTFSATTTVAAMATFALGALALTGDMRIAAAGGVAVTAILAGRARLHGWVQRITAEELRAGLMLLAMTFIALPLLPDREIGPFGGINPREIWLLAIILASVSFVGYVAVKVAGATRGILIAGLAGGLVSSTAVMVTNARRAASGEVSPHVLAAGAALATAVSLGRTIALIAALNPALLSVAAVPLAAAITVKLLAAALMAWNAPRDVDADHPTSLRNPFELPAVLVFAALLGSVVVLGRVLSGQFGSAGAIATGLVAGLADTDALVVSMAWLVPAEIGASTGAAAILAAVAANTVSKVLAGTYWGGGAFAAWTIGANGVAALAAVIAFAVAGGLGSAH